MSLRGIIDYSSSDDENDAGDEKDSQVPTTVIIKKIRNTKEYLLSENNVKEISTSDKDIKTKNPTSQITCDKIHPEPAIETSNVLINDVEEVKETDIDRDTSPVHLNDYGAPTVEEVATVKETEIHVETDIYNHDISSVHKDDYITTTVEEVATDKKTEINAELAMDNHDILSVHKDDYITPTSKEVATVQETEIHAELAISNHEISSVHKDDYITPTVKETATVKETEMLRLPGMSKKELEGLRCAVWKEVFTESTLDKNNHNKKSYHETVEGLSQEQRTTESSTGTGYNYEYYQYHYNQYQLYMENCRKNGGYSEEVARQYCDWLADFYTKLCKNDGSLQEVNHYSTTETALKHKSFEELQAQDRELEKYFESQQNTFGLARSVFKPTFRGTRTYKEHNKTYNPAHFNSLTKGANNLRAQFESSGSSLKKQNFENIERLPKSNKQKKREAWRDNMKAKIRKS